MSRNGDVRADVPMEIADSIEDVQCSVACLAEVLECVSVAVASAEEDCTEYIEGTMSVLLQAARAASEEATALLELTKAEDEQ
ncbi:hypothetical protein [Arabiibacter massiliensis]|uniref:hypothetical protein n=1 Tax=Arabiibacter massiliensis TaxID=1870985 RepID=UPI0009BAFE1F|nr:hypothetical protein [Arabiibacter massiliensis]